MAKINAKKKGNRNELFFAKLLTKRFKKTFKRVPMSGAFSTFNAGQNVNEGAMQVLSGDIIPPVNFKFSIEIKSRENFNFWDLLNNDTKNEIDKWIEQAEQEAKLSHKEPLIIFKRNNKKPFVIIKKELYEGKLTYGDWSLVRWDYFLELPDNFFFKEDKKNDFTR